MNNYPFFVLEKDDSAYDPKFMFKCDCKLCIFLRTYNGTYGGWCDPRRGYLESESDFKKRIPDGFLVWPEDHLF